MGSSSSTEAFDYEAQLLASVGAQSVEVKDEIKDDKRDCSLPVRNSKYPDLVKVPFAEEKGGCPTLWHAFQRPVQKHPKNNCLGTRVYETDEKTNEYIMTADGPKRGAYVWESYEDVDTVVRQLASGLLDLGCKAEDNIGLFSINRAEWLMTALAAYSQRMRVVSLYATLGEDAVEYIANHAEIGVVVVEKANLKKVIHLIPKVPTLKTIIQFDPNPLYKNVGDVVTEADREACKAAGVTLLGFSEVVARGKEKEQFPAEVLGEDLAMIMYTSGTTGVPKGAMLRHSNIIAAAASVPSIIQLQETDVHISYLPLAHIFESVIIHAVTVYGGAVGFFQGNVKKLTDDFQALSPSILIGVPRVFQKVYQKVFAGVAAKNFIARWYFGKAYNGQCTQLRANKPRFASYDNKVFIPLRNRIGLSKVRFILTGAAPCPPYLMEFLKVVVGCAVTQGYGMTEGSAGQCVTRIDDPNVGHCGPPLSSNDLKLRDVPDMNYLHTDKPYPRGEILVRGANVFAGYFKNPEATAETLTEDGWLCTGDIGRINPNGTISVIDRKKNLFKLAQGEYIAVEKVEAVYSKSPVVSQLWVYGNSFKSTVMAVIVPNAEYVVAHAKGKGWWSCDEAVGSPAYCEAFDKLFQGPHKDELKKFVFDELKKEAGSLKGFEKIQDVIVESKIDASLTGFTEANNCLTPTFKLRRPYLLDRYRVQLKALYTTHGEPDQAGDKWPGDQ